MHVYDWYLYLVAVINEPLPVTLIALGIGWWLKRGQNKIHYMLNSQRTDLLQKLAEAQAVNNVAKGRAIERNESRGAAK